MKKYALMLAATAFLIGGQVFAEETMKHETVMCDKHCNIKELEKKVDSLKTQAASSSKMATKDHLKKDIEVYEKKLAELKAEMDEMK